MDVSSDDGSAKSSALRVPNASPSACVDMAVMQADHERGALEAVQSVHYLSAHPTISDRPADKYFMKKLFVSCAFANIFKEAYPC